NRPNTQMGVLPTIRPRTWNGLMATSLCLAPSFCFRATDPRRSRKNSVRRVRASLLRVQLCISEYPTLYHRELGLCNGVASRGGTVCTLLHRRAPEPDRTGPQNGEKNAHYIACDRCRLAGGRRHGICRQRPSGRD